MWRWRLKVLVIFKSEVKCNNICRKKQNIFEDGETDVVSGGTFVHFNVGNESSRY